ncbi:hypothetical protein BDY21DRAFT_413929 [Lineolata rhizophorae]|uniref:Glycosyltransferase family 31 protein n=1 Tax=Lineolata rhizophorae TaxID=578093 RepID=A0A6A6P697_9PEZI|nr:hypothetical protein BDY21DRAFT_413929 [Lineolata rhizophorae]
MVENTSESHCRMELLQCSVNVAYLKSLGLDSNVEYARREIIAEFEKAAPSSKSIDVSMPDFHGIDIHSQSNPHSDIELPEAFCQSAVAIQFPEPQKRPDLSHIIFGVSTSVDRLEESLDQFAHWASHSNAKFVVLLHAETASPEAISRVERKAAMFGIALMFEQSDASFPDRYYSLTRMVYQMRDETTKWCAMIDDDTFFPSIAVLVDYLSGYDTSQPHYIGGLSEDFNQVKAYGYMAYGGAGVFMTMPLLAQIDGNFDSCYSLQRGGDTRIAHCVHQHTLTKLVVHPRLHQLDMNGDLSGFYESGRPQPLSIHHWKSWHHANMTALAQVASVCGDSCLLQRWRLNDGWFLTNGYSVMKPSGNLKEDDFTMEHTWNENGAYLHSVEPLRPKDDAKVSYKLEAAVAENEGNLVRQFYVKRSEGANRVLEIVWRQA